MIYYNEIDSHKSQWLNNLMAVGAIPTGHVDTRSIMDVMPSDLDGYTQCHFFAGIGVWAYALQQAGIPESRDIWTFSCPCQPFSTTGKKRGFADKRHLWPAVDWLMRQCRPGEFFAEQVASKDGLAWLDLVQTDLETAGYASGWVDICAAGFGAPHIRQRLYGYGYDSRRVAFGDSERGEIVNRPVRQSDANFIDSSGGVGHGVGAGLERLAGNVNDRNESRRVVEKSSRSTAPSGDSRDVELTDCESKRPANDPAWNTVTGGADKISRMGQHHCDGRDTRESPAETARHGNPAGSTERNDRPGPVNGAWRNVDWLYCRDDKWRPVESGTCPLVDGTAFDLGSGSAWAGMSRRKMLMGYGDAIVAPQAIAFIEAAIE